MVAPRVCRSDPALRDSRVGVPFSFSAAQENWEQYRKYQDAFVAAGIPWNQKGSPHDLRLKALHFLRKIPVPVLVTNTLQMNAAAVAENVTRNNAMLRRLAARYA